MIKLFNVITAWLLLLLGVFLGLLIVVLLPVLLTVALVGVLVFSNTVFSQWGVNVLEGFDNLSSALLGGDPDETLSSRLGKALQLGSSWSMVARLVDHVAFHLFGQLGHCLISIERDEGRKQVTKY